MTLEDILAQVDGAETKQRAGHLRALAEDHGDLAWLIEWAEEAEHPRGWHCPKGHAREDAKPGCRVCEREQGEHEALPPYDEAERLGLYGTRPKTLTESDLRGLLEERLRDHKVVTPEVMREACMDVLANARLNGWLDPTVDIEALPGRMLNITVRR